MCVFMCVCMHAHAHRGLLRETNHTYIHACLLACMHACALTCIIYIYIQIHTQIHISGIEETKEIQHVLNEDDRRREKLRLQQERNMQNSNADATQSFTGGQNGSERPYNSDGEQSDRNSDRPYGYSSTGESDRNGRGSTDSGEKTDQNVERNYDVRWKSGENSGRAGPDRDSAGTGGYSEGERRGRDRG